MQNHRNVEKKHFCPDCDHFHHVPNSNVPNSVGVCLYNPPAPFIVGMVPIAPLVANPDPTSNTMAPVIRAYYPPVGREDTCSQWTPRPAGEA
jgi:hypothetical protein